MLKDFRDFLLLSLDITFSVQVGRWKSTRHRLVLFFFLFRIDVSTVNAVLDTEELRFAEGMRCWLFLSPNVIFIAAIDNIVTPRLFRLQVARMRINPFKANLLQIIRLIGFPIDYVVVLITGIVILFLARIQDRRRAKFRWKYS